jgi:hypothetical protein
MLVRPGELPTGEGWAFEVKWDGFRAIASTEDGLRVRSRRGWDMSDRLPELAALPGGLVLDGEVVAFNDAGVSHFPDICARVLHGDASIAVRYAVFDVLRVDGHDLSCNALERPAGRARGARAPVAALSRRRRVRRRAGVVPGGLRPWARGRRGEAPERQVPARVPRLDQGQEPGLLAAGV